MNWKLFNVIFLGFGECDRLSLIATRLAIIINDKISLQLALHVFAITNFFSSAIVKLLGHKMSMFVSALAYLLYIVMFLKPTPVFMYTSSAAIGIGAAVLWTAQGEFLALQSSDHREYGHILVLVSNFADDWHTLHLRCLGGCQVC